MTPNRARHLLRLKHREMRVPWHARAARNARVKAVSRIDGWIVQHIVRAAWPLLRSCRQKQKGHEAIKHNVITSTTTTPENYLPLPPTATTPATCYYCSSSCPASPPAAAAAPDPTPTPLRLLPASAVAAVTARALLLPLAPSLLALTPAKSPRSPGATHGFRGCPQSMSGALRQKVSGRYNSHGL